MYATQDLPLNNCSYNRKASICPIIVISVIIAGMFLLGLGVLRFYAFRLECHLAEINQQIYSLELEELSLNQELASLRSPERIYTIAQNRLGMQGDSDFLKVTVASRPIRNSGSTMQLASAPRNTLFYGLMNLFASKASASN